QRGRRAQMEDRGSNGAVAGPAPGPQSAPDAERRLPQAPQVAALTCRRGSHPRSQRSPAESASTGLRARIAELRGLAIRTAPIGPNRKAAQHSEYKQSISSPAPGEALIL